MGEYAYRTRDGAHVKIGSCENMYYLRFDQLAEIARKDEHSLDPRSPGTWDRIRFRFPFPEEDAVPVGEFRDPDYGVTLYQIGVAAADLPLPDVDHHKVQFVSGRHGGYNVMLPCPASPEAKALEVDAGVKIHRNGGPAGVKIVQQRVWEGRLVLVADCAACGARYRYPTADDVQPVLEWIETTATALETHWNERERDPRRAAWWRKIADRIAEGYGNPPAAVAAAAAKQEA